MSSEEKVDKEPEPMEMDLGNQQNITQGVVIKSVTDTDETDAVSKADRKSEDVASKDISEESKNDEKVLDKNEPLVPSQEVNEDKISEEPKVIGGETNRTEEGSSDLHEDIESELLNKNCDSSALSNVSGNDINEPSGEVDVSDVSSSLAENESICDTSGKSKSSSQRPRRRTPAIMSGYRKRRKSTKKIEDDSDPVTKIIRIENGVDGMQNSEAEGSVCDERSEEGSHIEPSSSEENLFDGENCTSVVKTARRRSSVTSDPSDKFCWICHKENGVMYKCIACPRIFHPKCHTQVCSVDPTDDPENFQCPECVAALKADNVNTRSPTLATVNLDQLCVSLKHIISLLKSQKDSHYFWSPVDTKQFPHYREYVIHPMDLQMLEKNVSSKMYGCTEAFIADVKWIVHNSIVFNSKAAKITNVAKNLLKTCKREITEIETCAECYYNSIVRIDTWFLEVCKKPHLLVWARLKGYPPWPAKALKCKDNMVDCRFFGAHDKAWVPLKDCFLYSKLPPHQAKMRKGSHLELGIQELEKHINKLKDKFGIFRYPAPRTAYQPSIELEQIQMMLPNYNPKSIEKMSTKYLIHPDRIKGNVVAKTLFQEKEAAAIKEESGLKESEKLLEVQDNSSSCTDDLDKPLEVPAANKSLCDDSFYDSSENESGTSSESSEDEKGELAEAAVSKTPANTASIQVVEKSNCTPPTTGSLPANRNEKAKQLEADKVNKFVMVKKTETTASAIVPNLIRVLPTEAVNAKVSSSTEIKAQRIVKSKSPPMSSSPADSTSIAKSAPVLAVLAKKTTTDKTGCNLPKDGSIEFDLDNVKEEPMEVSDAIEDDVSQKPVAKKTNSASQPIFFTNKTKLATDDGAAPSVKKAKVDASCRTVNITENVTLSVVDQNQKRIQQQQAALRVVDYRNLMQKKVVQKAAILPKAVSVEMPPGPNKSKAQIPVTRANILSPTTPSTNKPVKILPRKMNQNVTVFTNGPTSNSSPTTNKTSNLANILSSNKMKEQISVNTAFDECLRNEFQTHFKEFFEKMLEKLAGAGDHRAKVALVQRELDMTKRSHELMIDELKRDYETQIAELRATSIARSQFDLAAERLKFEQEKERAVKEAKSKQWCSNCQKSANYYCCWNTAYCDFECQKEHWIQHMHVCKNDVKKKAAESSENEPPRIMMQNDASNGFLMNGYDKSTTTYTYQNTTSGGTCRNFNRGSTKIVSAVRSAPRALLPKVSSASIACMQPSTSSSVVGSSSPSSLAESASYQNVSSSTMAANRSRTFARPPTSFHK